MKKLWLIILLSLCLVLPCAAEEEPTVYTSGDYKYILLEDGKAEINDYIGQANHVDIPAKLDGYDVTSIGERAFSSCSSLTSITIPNRVTQIKGNPFLNCDRLELIHISPDNPIFAVVDGVLFNMAEKTLVCYPSVLSSNTYAIPNSVTSIGEEAFSGCPSLTSITISDSVTSIGKKAFRYCTNLTSITIPNSVTSIGERAFYRCKSLTSIIIPDSVTSISFGAFFGCTSLTSITVARGSYAEQWCLDAGYSVKYDDEWNCTECGTLNKYNFCAECGASKPVLKTQCDSCGFQFEGDTMPKFCPVCGVKQ